MFTSICVYLSKLCARFVDQLLTLQCSLRQALLLELVEQLLHTILKALLVGLLYACFTYANAQVLDASHCIDV